MRILFYSLLIGCALLANGPARAATVSTILGDGKPGYSDTEVNNPYGMVIGPDGALYFCDLGNQRIRRLDLKTSKVTLVAGNGAAGYSGDGGPAMNATMRAPHELAFAKDGNLYFAERDNHVVRKVDMKTGIISTAAGTGAAGYSGDGGPGPKAQLSMPQCLIADRRGDLLICDMGNQRIRRLDPASGTIETWAGTGEAAPTPENAPMKGTPLHGARAIAIAPNGDYLIALRDANVILRLDAMTGTYHRIAGTGQAGYAGDGGPAMLASFGGTATGRTLAFAGPKGLTLAPRGILYIADTDSHTIRRLDLSSGIITSVVGTGTMGDGPESSPTEYKLARPHGVLFTDGKLYVADSESHRILLFRP